MDPKTKWIRTSFFSFYLGMDLDGASEEAEQEEQ
jgi:hypothetical protein